MENALFQLLTGPVHATDETLRNYIYCDKCLPTCGGSRHWEAGVLWVTALDGNGIVLLPNFELL